MMMNTTDALGHRWHPHELPTFAFCFFCGRPVVDALLDDPEPSRAVRVLHTTCFDAHNRHIVEPPTLPDAVTREARTIDIQIQTSNRTTDWLLRNLEGKWLIEGTSPRVMSARCDESLDAVMSHAMDYHDGMQDDDR